MHDLFTFDYAILRIVPRVEREEFLNVGVVLYCPTQEFLRASIELDETRLAAFAPTLNIQSITDHLATIPLICAGGPAAGPIGALPQRARFHWLVAPRSTTIQVSAVHSGACRNLEAALEGLLDKMVRPSLPGTS